MTKTIKQATNKAFLKSLDILVSIIYDKHIENIDKVDAIRCLIELDKNIRFEVKENGEQ